jgi:phosphotransferase system  glucose/maltose/N-acetylglucosamine-specific IIC component
MLPMYCINHKATSKALMAEYSGARSKTKTSMGKKIGGAVSPYPHNGWYLKKYFRLIRVFPTYSF